MTTDYAYALVWYHCGPCGHAERFWNAQENIPPVTYTCPSCGRESLRRADFLNVEPAKDHVPHFGQGVIVQATTCEKVAHATSVLRSRFPDWKQITPRAYNRLLVDIFKAPLYQASTTLLKRSTGNTPLRPKGANSR